jgi:hypothetical protein
LVLGVNTTTGEGLSFVALRLFLLRVAVMVQGIVSVG